MKKKENWQIALHSYFKEQKRIPFDKDKHNCGHFVADGLQVMFDQDFFAQYRKHKTYEAQIKAFRKSGFENHVDFISSKFNSLSHPSQAKFGDIVAFDVDDELGVAVGFVISEICYVMRENGLAIYSLANATKAFET